MSETRRRRERPDAGSAARPTRAVAPPDRAARPPLPDAATLRAALEEARGPEPEAPPPPDPGSAAEPAAEPIPASAPEAPLAPDAAWAGLRTFDVDPGLLERHLVITAGRTHPAHGAFDVLRTKLVRAMAERGWARVGVTSPTKGCGKTFTALNLAVTLSRHEGRRTVLLDLDLRQPALARSLGIGDPGSIGDALRGAVPWGAVLRRPGPNGLQIGPGLAVGPNGPPEAYAAELFEAPEAAAAFSRLEAEYRPDVTLIDLPPALAQDDVIALRPRLDCVLLVAGGGQTTAREMKEAVRRLGEDLPILGVVLNKAEGEGVYDYAY